MKTITIGDLLDARACETGLLRYYIFLGLADKGSDTDTLPDPPREVLDQERYLADYLSADTLSDCIWALRCVDGWRDVVTAFAAGCHDTAKEWGVAPRMYQLMAGGADRSSPDPAWVTLSPTASASSAAWWCYCISDAMLQLMGGLGCPQGGVSVTRVERQRQAEHLLQMLRA